MCFSAPASFTVAAATGLVGALAVRKVTSWREIPLATIPLMFALQQTVEGTLWILLARDDQATMVVPFANIFASFALIAWPVWAPLSALLVEPARVRQLGMVVLFILAVPIAFIGLRDISAHPYSVCVVGRSLSYSNGTAYSLVELSAYAVCVCCPLLLSTHRMLRMFGAIVVFGLPVSAAFYYVTSFSVWCFFAAAGSVTIYLYFSTAPKVAPTPLSA